MNTTSINGLKLVKVKTSKFGYKYFVKNGKMVFLHRFIFETLKHKIPEGMVINHKDFNKKNNNIENLECISISENVRHYTQHKRKKKLEGFIKDFIRNFPEYREELIEKIRTWK